MSPVRFLKGAANVLATSFSTASTAATIPVTLKALTGPLGISRESSQLAAWVNADSGDATAGTTFYHLDLTNTSRRTCWVSGWPGVAAANWAGGQLGVPAVRRADVRARIVNIPPGGTAHSTLGYVDVQVTKQCKPAAATYLKVFPPEDKTPHLVRRRWVSSNSFSNSSIRAVRPETP